MPKVLPSVTATIVSEDIKHESGLVNQAIKESSLNLEIISSLRLIILWHHYLCYQDYFFKFAMA